MIYYRKRNVEVKTMAKRKRIIYALLSAFLLLSEIFIALFVHDRIIRPYVGDVLVTTLLCALVRIFFPNKIRFLSLYVLIFATLVEIGQYFDYAELLGLSNIEFFSVLMGRSFSFVDIICYAIGCAVFAVIEITLNKITIRNKQRSL